MLDCGSEICAEMGQDLTFDCHVLQIIRLSSSALNRLQNSESIIRGVFDFVIDSKSIFRLDLSSDMIWSNTKIGKNRF